MGEIQNIGHFLKTSSGYRVTAPEGFVAPIKPGRILIEAEGVPFKVAQEALRLAAQKLPIPVKFVVRRDYVEKTN